MSIENIDDLVKLDNADLAKLKGDDLADLEIEPHSLPPRVANRIPIEPEKRMQLVNVGGFPVKDHHTLKKRVPGSDVTQDQILGDVDNPESWLVYNKGVQQTGFAPIDRLTPENINTLSEEYVIQWDTAAMEIEPTIVPGDPPVAYVTTSHGTIEAINARTGETYWQYRWSPRTKQKWTRNHSRGVGIWGNKVYYATEDNTILALNRYTGERVTDWGSDRRPGEAELLWREDQEYPQMLFWTYQSQAPTVYDGKIYIGDSTDVEWGCLHVVDAESGKVLWRKKGPDPDGWVGNSWVHGATSSWMSPAIDPESETVVFALGDPSSFFNTLVRPGPNKHSLSLVAIDAQSFETKWTHQVLPQEEWDYDLGATPAIVDVDINGRTRRGVKIKWKAGWTMTIDVETGQLLSRSEPWAAAQEHKFGGWPDSKFLNLVPFEDGPDDNVIKPAVSGASEWPPETHSPDTGLSYVGVTDSAYTVYASKDWHWEHGKIKPQNPDDTAGGIGGPPDGFKGGAQVVAYELDGDIKWRYHFEDIAPGTPNAWPGGTTATAGNLLFAGSFGGNLVALNATTGDRLGRVDTGARITASPVIWDDPSVGKQYIAIAANDRLLVYSGGK